MTPMTPKPVLSRLAALAAFSLLLTPALPAQNSGRGFLKAQGGSTFTNGEANLTASGGFGVRITDSLDLFAEAGTIRNSCDFGFLGSRITLPLRSVITPFFEIGGGAGRIAPKLRSALQSMDTRFMLTASGGIHLAATRRVGFDFAYRHLRFASGQPGFSTNLISAGIVYRF